MGERTRSKNLPAIISIKINVIATILGLSLTLHASVYQEDDWAIFFSLLTALSAVTALLTSRS
jgi:hypothetical protein